MNNINDSIQIPKVKKDWIKKVPSNRTSNLTNSLKHLIGVEWQNRYFVLENGTITYYKDQTDDYPYGTEKRGIIYVKDLIIVDRNHKETNECQLLLLSKSTYEKVLYLTFDSSLKADKWRDAFHSHIDYYTSSSSSINTPSNDTIKNDDVHASIMISSSEAIDIIKKSSQQVLSIPIISEEVFHIATSSLSGLINLAEEIPFIGPAAKIIQKFYGACKNVSTNYKELLSFRERVDFGVMWLTESTRYFSHTNEKLLKAPLDHLTTAVEEAVHLIENLKRLESKMTIVGTVTNLILNSKDQDDLKSIRGSLDIAIDDLLKTVPAMAVFRKHDYESKNQPVESKLPQIGLLNVSTTNGSDNNQIIKDIVTEGAKHLLSIPIISDEVINIATSSLSGLINLAEEIPFIGPAAKIIQKFYGACKNVSTNYKEFDNFRERVDFGVMWLTESTRYFSHTNEKLLKAPLDHLTTAVEEAVHLIENLKKRLGDKITIVGTIINLILNSKDQDDLKSIRGSLDIAIDDLLKTVPAMEVFREESQRLRRLLDPRLYDSELERFSKIVQKDSRLWLHSEFDNWFVTITSNNNLTDENQLRVDTKGNVIRKKSDNLFWLQADAGMGKSAFSASLICRYIKKKKMLGAFFLKFNEKTDAKIVWRSLGYQIAMMFPDSSIYKMILDFAEKLSNNSYSEEQLFKELILNPLVEIYKTSNNNQKELSNMLVVIDALDEVGEINSRQNFLNVMSAQIQKLPKFIKLFVTSRPEQDIINKFEKYYTPTYIREDDPRHIQDLIEYIRYIFNQTVLKTDNKLLEDAVTLLFNKSQSKFVYVASVYETLKNYFDNDFIEKEDILNDLKHFPEGLSETYKKYFDQIKSNSSEYINRINKLLLKILVCSREPMLQTDIQILLSDVIHTPEDLNKLCGLIHTIFPLRGEAGSEKFIPYHKSIIDWLTDPFSSMDYYIDVKEGHQILSERLLQQIKGYDGLVSNQLIMPYENGNNCIYIYKYLTDHLDETNRQVDSIRLLFDFKWILALLKYKNRNDLISDLIERSRAYNNDKSKKGFNKQKQLKLLFQFIKLVSFSFDQSREITLMSKELYFQLNCRFQSIISNPENDYSLLENLLASAKTYVNPLDIWEIKNATLLTPDGLIDSILIGHNFNSIVALPDGRVVSGSSDLRIWNIDTGICEKDIHLKKCNFRFLRLLLDGRIITLSTSDNTIRIVNIDSGECEKIINGGSIKFKETLSVLSDHRIAVGYDDNTIQIWDIDDGKCEKILQGHTNDITALDVLPDGDIVSSSRDNTLRIWNVNSGECGRVIQLGNSPTRRYLFCILSNSKVVTGNTDGEIKVWNINTGECERRTREDENYSSCNGITSLIALPDDRFVSSSENKSIKIWNSLLTKCELVLEGHTKEVTSLCILSDGRIVSGSEDCTLRVWNIDKQIIQDKYIEEHKGEISSVSILSDGRLISGSLDQTVRIWNSASGECDLVLDLLKLKDDLQSDLEDDFKMVTGARKPKFKFKRIDYSDNLPFELEVLGLLDNQVVIGKIENKKIRIWNTITGKCTQKIITGIDNGSKLNFLPNGKIITSSRDNKEIEIRNFETGEYEKCLVDPENEKFLDTTSVINLPRYGEIACYGNDIIRIFNINTGELEGVIRTPCRIHSVNLLKDGSIICALRYMNKCQIYDINTGEYIKEFETIINSEFIKVLKDNSHLVFKVPNIPPPIYMDGLCITHIKFIPSNGNLFAFLNNNKTCILIPPKNI